MMSYKWFCWILLYLCLSFIIQNLSIVTPTSQTKTCPKEDETTFSKFKAAFDCSNIYMMKDDALLNMAANNSDLHDLISQNATPPGFLSYNIMACSDFNVQKRKCELSRMKLFAAVDKLPFKFLPNKQDVNFPVCGSGYGRSGCGTFQNLTSPCGKIRYKAYSEEHPVPIAQDIFPQCKWTIISPVNMRIKVSFKYLFIRYCSSDCPCDSLDVYDVVNGIHVLNRRYCGRRLDWVLYSESNIINIILNRANGSVMPGMFKHRLEFTYKTISADNFTFLSKPTIFNAENGSISFQNLTPAYSINDSLLYQLQIRTVEHGVLALKWEWENRCNSSVQLMIHDGPVKRNSPIRNISLTALKVEGNQDLPGFIAFVELKVQSSCKQIAMSLQFLTKQRKILSGNFSVGHCQVVNITEMRLFILNSKTNNSHLLHRCLHLTAPRGKYISFSFSTFHFEGPNHDNCQSEGLVFWDGPNVEAAKKFGPYCGTEAHQLAFSQPDTVTVSSSDVLIIVLYWYPNGGNKHTKVELLAAVTDCVGEFNWLSTFNGSNAANSKQSAVDSRNIVNITLQPNRCIQLQLLPSYNPVNVKYYVRIFSNLMGFNNLENETLTNPFGAFNPGPCSELASDTGTFSKLSGIFVNVSLANCSYMPVSYRIRVTNSVKATCDIDDIYSSDNLRKKERLYLGTLCGTINLHCITQQHVVLRSPRIKKNGFHYVFELRTKDRKQISFGNPESFFLMVDESKNYKHSYKHPKLEISSLPFHWKTSWSFHVDFYLKTKQTQHCIPKLQNIVLEYKLVQSNYPTAVIPSLNCNSSWYEYRNHCYQVFLSNSSMPHITWVEGQSYCEALGGYLVTLNTKEELNFIQGLFVDHYHSNLQDDYRKYYIGMASEDMVEIYIISS